MTGNSLFNIFSEDSSEEEAATPNVPKPITRSESYDATFLRHRDASDAFTRSRHVSSVVAPSVVNGRIRRNFSTSDFPGGNTKLKRSSPKNGSMVLQLVLPEAIPSSSENGNYFSGPDRSPSTNSKRRAASRSDVSSQPDFFSVANGAYLNRVYSGSDLGEEVFYPKGGVSDGSERSDLHLLKPTTEEEKKRVFRDNLTQILSWIYALFIVTLGFVVYISDAIVGNSPVAETFTMYLVITAFVFLIYLITSIRLFIHKKNKYNNLMEHNRVEGVEFIQGPDGKYQLSLNLPAAAKISKPLPHFYCLSKGRHSGSIYLKIGAAGFCLGHLIHSGLLLGYQIVFLTSDGEAFYECASIATLILDFIYPIYSFTLLYFIFKYSNVIINKHTSLARFGLMHCISSSLCFWLWTIIRETLDALIVYDDYHKSESRQVDSYDRPVALPLTPHSERGAEELRAFLNITKFLFSRGCENDEGLRIIYQNFSPYLYPFSVEFSILVVGILFIVWQSIGSCKEDEETCCSNNSDSPDGSGKLESNVVIHADCHAANKGLFSGIIILILCIVSIILFFIAITDKRYIQLAIFINGITEAIVLVLMILAGFWAYRQITRLDHNHHPISLLDDLLLFICIPAFFVNAIFSIIPAVQNGNALSIVVVIVQITQVLIQTPMIIDGLRRCSNCRELQKNKPGREVITFLIVCNVALWITQTFEVKTHDLEDERYDYYGKVLWTVLGHMCLPLMMFYRFHSSVCIVDIWKHGYEPASH